MITLNSLWYYNENTEVEHLEDVAEQKAFTEKWLAYAREHNEKVWLVAHISSGMGVFEPFNVWFSEIATEYQDIIKASFYGHTHRDEFYLNRDIHDEKRAPVHVNLVSAAFEGMGGNNPAVRLYEFDDETKEIINYTVFVADLEKMAKSRKLEWEVMYQAKEQLGLSDLKPTTVLAWAEKMWDDDDAFQEYMRCYHTGYYTKGSCTGTCKVKALCSLLYVTSSDRDQCKKDHS